jgi:hypothetical protein
MASGGDRLSDAERDLLQPHASPPVTRWVRDIDTFTRRWTHDFAGARFG